MPKWSGWSYSALAGLVWVDRSKEISTGIVMIETRQLINPYHRLEFILSLKEVSESGAISGKGRQSYVFITLYDYLYVDVEIGRAGATWEAARKYLGVHGINNERAIEVGKILDSYFADISLPISPELIESIIADAKLIELSQEIWSDLVCCQS